jgi:hypothetical protein
MRHYAEGVYHNSYDELINQSDKPDPKRGKKIREIQSRYKHRLKLIDARNQKIIRCQEILEAEVAKRQPQ